MRPDYYSTWMKYLGLFLVISVILTFVNFWIVNRDSSNYDQYVYYSNDLRVLSQEIANDTTIAFTGNKTALDALEYHRDQFIFALKILKEGGLDPRTNTKLPPSPPEIQQGEISEIEKIWNPFLVNVNTILKLKQVISIYDQFRVLLGNAPKIHNLISELMNLIKNSKQQNVDLATLPCKEFLYVERALHNANNILQGAQNTLKDAQEIQEDMAAFSQALNTLSTVYKEDATIQQKIREIEQLSKPMEDFGNAIVQHSNLFSEAGVSNIEIYNNSYGILGYATKLVAAYAQFYFDEKYINVETAYAMIVISFLILMALIYFGYKNSDMNIQMTRDLNRKTQAEIQLLVDELGDLANGNLKVQASVTGGITTAISQAINYAIEALRRLVTTIHQISDQISTQAQAAEQKTRSLAKASENQKKEITGATESVNNMSASIEKVSATAQDSATVADNSVKIAHEGSQIVQNTIGGMERIREQIQETEKRIRRLGESSQEIGDIVSLMDDIAEQTNILSLNAAIQAAMAGEEGRGFAVVADEVQRLAERSSQAAKEVESLVKTIQSDTSQAAVSMERAITEVTQGTKLAQEAGVALEKIESVSKDLASLIQNISSVSTQQAEVSSKIARTMRVIKDIASQTAEGSGETADSMGNLTALLSRLRQSISGFKLPESELKKLNGEEINQ